MGYGGASFVFLLSVAGAFTAGANIIKQVEASFFAFLETFQDDERFGGEAFMDDPDRDAGFKTFLVAYAIDIAVMTVVTFWHILFLIMMGVGTSATLFSQIESLNSKAFGYDGATIPVFYGWQLLFFGMITGVTNYICGMALSVNKETILKMVGFTATLENESSATMSTAIGGSSYTITLSEDEESKKPWYDLYEVFEKWSLLFFSQRGLQIALPYAYLLLLEVIPAAIFGISFLFFFPTKGS